MKGVDEPLFDDPLVGEAVAVFARENGAVSLMDLMLIREAVASGRIDRADDVQTILLDSEDEA